MSVANPRIFPDLGYYKWYDQSTFEVWYAINQLTCPTSGVSTRAINQIRAMPFYSGMGGRLDRIAFEVTTAAGTAGSMARCGIYTSTSDTNLYPDALVVDSGEFSVTSTGIKSATIDVQLLPNKLYYFAVFNGTSVFTGRNFASGTIASISFGTPSTLGTGTNLAFSKSTAYGSLPSTYPSSATLSTGGDMLFVRYAS